MVLCVVSLNKKNITFYSCPIRHKTASCIDLGHDDVGNLPFNSNTASSGVIYLFSILGFEPTAMNR